MRLLLDTHVFLWYVTGDPRLPAGVVTLICQAIQHGLTLVSADEAVRAYSPRVSVIP
jgi:PIN domain nuclease of toxin-antitoxin system